MNKSKPQLTSPLPNPKPPCEFDIWHKDTKTFGPCGKPGSVEIDEQFFCEEHYIDAIMQIQGSTGEYLTDEHERLVRKE